MASNEFEELKARLKKKKTGKKKVDPDHAIKAMVKKSKVKHDNIYVLSIKNEKNSYFYVGRTTSTIEKRLKKHLSESKNEKCQTKKCLFIRECLKQDKEIVVKLLESVSLDAPSSAEDTWMTNFSGAGCELMNSQNGDTERYEYVTCDDDSKKSKWSAELFYGDWIKGGCRSKSNESYKLINGIEFYKVGNSKLRFDHNIYGAHLCEGWDYESKVKNAIAHFTEGTEQRKRMIQWCKENNKF
ncbi:MAG: GIY-YIG nuclease family protein [Pseudomonadota bacterium]